MKIKFLLLRDQIKLGWWPEKFQQKNISSSSVFKLASGWTEITECQQQAVVKVIISDINICNIAVECILFLSN